MIYRPNREKDEGLKILAKKMIQSTGHEKFHLVHLVPLTINN